MKYNYEIKDRSPVNKLGKMQNFEASLSYRTYLCKRLSMNIGVHKLILLNTL